MNSDDKNKKLCKGCIICCTHVTSEIDEPKTKDDYEDIIWMLMHEDVSVFIDDDGWNVEFKTKCKHLTEEGLCLIYSKRPSICKNYDQDGCVKHGEGEFCDYMFNTKEDLLKYLEEKGIDLDNLNH